MPLLAAVRAAWLAVAGDEALASRCCFYWIVCVIYGEKACGIFHVLFCAITNYVVNVALCSLHRLTDLLTTQVCSLFLFLRTKNNKISRQPSLGYGLFSCTTPRSLPSFLPPTCWLSLLPSLPLSFSPYPPLSRIFSRHPYFDPSLRPSFPSCSNHRGRETPRKGRGLPT